MEAEIDECLFFVEKYTVVTGFDGSTELLADWLMLFPKFSHVRISKMEDGHSDIIGITQHRLCTEMLHVRGAL